MTRSLTVMPAYELALERLMDGNKRYETAKQTYPHQTASRRQALREGQKPFALVLSCADSRVPPELIFDQGLGDLFVIRVAGHAVDDTVLASVEFAILLLDVSLVMVLGHSQCGAVEAACGGGELPGNMSKLVAAIQPAVAAAKKLPGSLAENAVKINAKMTAEKLLARSSLLRQSASDDRVKIVVALYTLDTGVVELLT